MRDRSERNVSFYVPSYEGVLCKKWADYSCGLAMVAVQA